MYDHTCYFTEIQSFPRQKMELFNNAGQAGLFFILFARYVCSRLARKPTQERERFPLFFSNGPITGDWLRNIGLPFHFFWEGEPGLLHQLFHVRRMRVYFADMAENTYSAC